MVAIDGNGDLAIGGDSHVRHGYSVPESRGPESERATGGQGIIRGHDLLSDSRFLQFRFPFRGIRGLSLNRCGAGSNTEDDCGNEREDRIHGNASYGGDGVKNEPTPKV
jgi:hypothetical protein